MERRDIVVIGASAGGVEAVLGLARKLPGTFPAAVFVIIHISPSAPGLLPQLINKISELPAAYAEHGESIKHGRIYVARPDHHLLLVDSQIHLTRGPRENGFRPAVDPLFRTAAEIYGPRVIGVVLSGGLDDGTEGLKEIKRHGGIAIVQDPDTALHASMPASAIRDADVDLIVPVEKIPDLLVQLTGTPALTGGKTMPKHKGKRTPDPTETADLSGSKGLAGPPSGFVCPECGGALWENVDGKVLKYRCHVGHAFTQRRHATGRDRHRRCGPGAAS